MIRYQPNWNDPKSLDRIAVDRLLIVDAVNADKGLPSPNYQDPLYYEDLHNYREYGKSFFDDYIEWLESLKAE